MVFLVVCWVWFNVLRIFGFLGMVVVVLFVVVKVFLLFFVLRWYWINVRCGVGLVGLVVIVFLIRLVIFFGVLLFVVCSLVSVSMVWMFLGLVVRIDLKCLWVLFGFFLIILIVVKLVVVGKNFGLIESVFLKFWWVFEIFFLVNRVCVCRLYVVGVFGCFFFRLLIVFSVLLIWFVFR